MAYLAIRGSGGGQRRQPAAWRGQPRSFEPLFPRWPTEEVPVGHVTNGIHVPTWDSDRGPRALEGFLRTRLLERRIWSRWKRASAGLPTRRSGTCGARRESRWSSMCALVMRGRSRSRAARPREIAEAGNIFDPNALTLGFARRFATYKRPNLLLHDPRSPDANSEQSSAAGSTGPGRQGASAGRPRTRDDPAVERVYPWLRNSLLGGVPDGLRHVHDPTDGQRRRRMDQHAAPAVWRPAAPAE